MDSRHEGTAAERRALSSPTAHHYFIPSSYQAYRLLQFVFIAAPIIAGLDKFAHVLVNWNVYLTPLVPAVLGVSPEAFMRVVGVVEIIAGVIVAFNPRIGGAIVGAWLLGIIVNLLTIPGFYDIALRDFGLSMAAFSLAMLSREFRYYRKPR